MSNQSFLSSTPYIEYCLQCKRYIPEDKQTYVKKYCSQSCKMKAFALKTKNKTK